MMSPRQGRSRGGLRALRNAVSSLLVLALFAGCVDEGPAEEMGEDVDEAIEDTRDAGEDVGDEIGDAADDAGDAIDDAVDDIDGNR